MANPIPISAPVPSEEWETPDDLYATLEHIWQFDFDAAASVATTPSARASSLVPSTAARCPGTTGAIALGSIRPMAAPSSGSSRPRSARLVGVSTVALLPARVDTSWWHQHVAQGANGIWFLKGRLRFKGAPASAPFPSAVVYWHSARPGASPPLEAVEIAMLGKIMEKRGHPCWSVRGEGMVP